jgi:hypothetical protein
MSERVNEPALAVCAPGRHVVLYVAALCASLHSAPNDFVRMINEQLYP